MDTKLLIMSALLALFSLAGAELCHTKRYLLLDSEDIDYKSCPGPGDPAHFTQCCPGPSWSDRSHYVPAVYYIMPGLILVKGLL